MSRRPEPCWRSLIFRPIVVARVIGQPSRVNDTPQFLRFRALRHSEIYQHNRGDRKTGAPGGGTLGDGGVAIIPDLIRLAGLGLGIWIVLNKTAVVRVFSEIGRGGKGRMPNASCESRQALKKAQNGNGQLLSKVGMDLGLAPRRLGFGAARVWGWRRAGLGSTGSCCTVDAIGASILFVKIDSCYLGFGGQKRKRSRGVLAGQKLPQNDARLGAAMR
jgi:hypothetical protein